MFCVFIVQFCIPRTISQEQFKGLQLRVFIAQETIIANNAGSTTIKMH